MKVRSDMRVRRSGWHLHLPDAGAVGANLHRWAVGEGSLTARLMAASSRFDVVQISQRLERPLAGEWQALGMKVPEPALTRDVLLVCDGVPAVYGHTVVLPHGARRDWPFLGGLGNRPLGGALFVDPKVSRDPFRFARLRGYHPLRARLARIVPALADLPASTVLVARRSVFRRGGGAMLVTEVFLPGVLAHRAPRFGEPLPLLPKRSRDRNG